MYEFDIPDMSCGHCVRAITEAVQGVDAQAKVEATLPEHRVQVDSQASRDQLVVPANQSVLRTRVPANLLVSALVREDDASPCGFNLAEGMAVVTIVLAVLLGSIRGAIAVAIGTYGVTSGQALAGVVGPLIEVPVLVGLVYVSLALRNRFIDHQNRFATH